MAVIGIDHDANTFVPSGTNTSNTVRFKLDVQMRSTDTGYEKYLHADGMLIVPDLL
jgi:hypothetical protein